VPDHAPFGNRVNTQNVGVNSVFMASGDHQKAEADDVG
jgi:hypothetical protein